MSAATGIDPAMDVTLGPGAGADPDDAWLAGNERWLLARVARLRARLAGVADHAGPADDATDGPEAVRAAMTRPPPLERLAGLLELSDFVVDLLVLLVGMELDPGMGALVGRLQGHGHATAPTPGLAIDVLDGAHWQAFAPSGPLRHLRMLVVIPDGSSLATAGLRLDERVLHHLLGVDDPDERLAPFVTPLVVTGPLVDSHVTVADRVATAWAGDGAGPASVHVPVQVWGPHRDDRRQVLAAAAAGRGHPARRIAAEDLPADPSERDGLRRLLVREWILRPALLAIEIGGSSDDATARAVALATDVPGAVLSGRRPAATETPTVDVAVAPATSAERWRLLAPFVGMDATSPGPPATTQFALGTARLVAAGRDAARDEREPADALWSACRRQARARLDGLAQRIDPVATWTDLVVPATVEATLRGIRAHVVHRSLVHDRWGWRDRGTRGLGVTALFSGASGTGKTMAAEVLANDLALDLYRIDLSAVVSKYIGETEKNLGRVFDAAETGGAILLFDEADALFGKRTEVRDSHDRYANIEVSYLLQRMEAYRGLAILTTNLRDGIDEAFLRRIRFVVRFPFPDHDDRVRLWRGAWPDDVPLADLDLDRLARLGLAGGSIRAIALDASFRAAARANGRAPAVDMDVIADAVRAEARKSDVSLRAEDWGETP